MGGRQADRDQVSIVRFCDLECGKSLTPPGLVRGLDAVSAARAKHEAQEQAKLALAQSGQFRGMEYERRPYEGQEYRREERPPQFYEQGGYQGYQGPPGGGFGGQGGYGGPQQGYGGPQQGYGGPQQGYGGPGEYGGEHQ